MKKILLFGLMALTGLVQAEAIATLPNKAGGEIYFTNVQCSNKSEQWSIVYSATSDGSALYGCYVYADGLVHVTWDTGKNSIFKVSDMKLVKKSKTTAI